MTTDRREPVAIACTLETADDVDQRVRDWQEVLARAVEREELDAGVRLRFETDAATAADLARLAALEVGCCAWLDFDLTVSSTGTTLVVRAPQAGRDVVLSLFGGAT
jgi:hypothetical protein